MDMQKVSASTLGPMYKDYWDNDFIKSFSDGFGFDYAEPPDACCKGPTIENYINQPYPLTTPVPEGHGFEISINVAGYKPEDITVRTRADNYLIIEGKREKMAKGYGCENYLIFPGMPEKMDKGGGADNCLITEGKREEMREGDVLITTKFTRRYLIPDGIDPETFTCTLIYGSLKITAPRKVKVSDRILPITVLE